MSLQRQFIGQCKMHMLRTQKNWPVVLHEMTSCFLVNRIADKFEINISAIPLSGNVVGVEHSNHGYLFRPFLHWYIDT